MDAGTGPALAAAIAALATSRLLELRRSRANERLLRARGGRPVAGDVFPAFVALHVAFFLAIPAEVWLMGASPPPSWPLWLVLWVIGEGLRLASVRALGDRWTVRVFVIPGEARCRRGPYRLFAHPNYVGVMLELAAVPLLFGAWRTALIGSAVNLVLLGIRVRREEGALEAAEREVSSAAEAR